MKKQLIVLSLLAASASFAQTPLTAQSALELAAKNRPTLHAARLNIEQAQLAAKSFSAALPTTLSLGASTRNDLGATDQDLAFNQPIDLFGKGSANRKVGSTAVLRARADYLATATQLQTEVLSAFTVAVATQHLSEVADDLLTIATGLLTATKRRFDEGKVAELQLVRARIELERAKSLAASRSADAQAAIKRLEGVTGAQLGTTKVSSDEMLVPIEKPSASQRPDLQILLAQIKESEAEVASLRASNKPDFSLQLIKSPWGSQPETFAGRAQFSFNVFDNGKTKHGVAAAEKRAASAKRLYDDWLAQAEAELRASAIDLASRQQTITSYDSILLSARDLVAKAQKGYSEGFGTQVDVLEATRALREVEQELVEARQQLSLAVIAQYKASGFLNEVLK